MFEFIRMFLARLENEMGEIGWPAVVGGMIAFFAAATTFISVFERPLAILLVVTIVGVTLAFLAYTIGAFLLSVYRAVQRIRTVRGVQRKFLSGRSRTMEERDSAAVAVHDLYSLHRYRKYCKKYGV